MVTKKTPKVVLTAVAIVIAAYILSPFYLVLINTFKNANGIVANPVSFAGASFAQFKTNISNVVNNSNFSFWSAFGTSAIITVVSLVLLGGMAAWVICRNKTKWSTAIYMTFIASMTIPFQVVMLPLVSTFRDVGKFLGINMLQSVPGIVFAYCGFGGAMTVFILTGFIKGIPYELEEAAANSTLNHTIHNLLLSKQEYDDHRNHCQECCSKDQIPLFYIRTNKRLYSNRKSLNLTILS